MLCISSNKHFHKDSSGDGSGQWVDGSFPPWETVYTWASESFAARFKNQEWFQYFAHARE